MNTTTLSPKYQAIEDSRSDAAKEIERVNEALTRYWMEHGTCDDEIREFKTARRLINEIAGDDDLASETLELTLVKDFYRSLYGRQWKGQ